MPSLSKAESHARLSAALQISEGHFQSERRRQGKDMFWQWYLLERRVRLTFILAVYPLAKPVLDWLVKSRA